MAEYIEREDLIRRLELRIKSWSGDCNSNAGKMVLAYQEILHIVKNISTADVVPKSEVEREIEGFEQKVDGIYNHYVFEDTDYSEDDVAVEAVMNALTEVLNGLDKLKEKFSEKGQEQGY